MSIVDSLSGIIPALATPLTDERKIHETDLRRLVQFVLDAGVRAVFTMGSTGEFSAFTREERRLAIDTVLDEVGGRVPVFAGVSDAGTELAVRNVKEAEAAGVDAIVAVLPYYFPLGTQQAALDHFRHIADSTSLPLIVYNVPQAVKSVIHIAAIRKLAEEGAVAAVKESSTDFTYFQDLILSLSDMPRVRVFQGSEFHLAASVFMGAHGGVLGIANLAPHLCVQVYEAASSGSIDEARKLQRRLTKVCQVFWAGESVVGSLKAAMSVLGICSPITTLPIPAASDESRAKICRIVEDCGLRGPE